MTSAAEVTNDVADSYQAITLTLERNEGAVLLSAQLNLLLPGVVEEALLKGIPIYFVAQAEVLRKRWYWSNRKIAVVQRRMRLSYHPLTRRWRLNLGSGDMTEDTQRLSLSQNFDNLEEVMAAVRRVSRWKIADAADIEAGSQHLVNFSFSLDTAQLPRPLQIGTLGQSDWMIELTAAAELEAEPAK